jgi:hypothetical protein
MAENELMEWLDALREVDYNVVGLCTDDDYALIFDRTGVSWTTMTLETGEQVKRIAQGWQILGIE